MTLGRRSFILFATGGLGASIVRILPSAEIEFTDAKAQTLQFMRWYEEIELSPEQEAVKKEALDAIPAPCCADNSSYTCCCECNISRTIWGLSQYMIAKQGANAAQVRDRVKEWISFIGPKPPRGYSGSGCYTGQCPQPFSHGGCGGMHPSKLAI